MDGSDEFPWHLGVFDAHCHPTDTLTNVQSLPLMRAKALTVMATRAQDQELVAKVATDYGVTEGDIQDVEREWSKEHKIIPAFGWHPWFSHQMFDEDEYNGASTLSSEQKLYHYQSVLNPKPEDVQFVHRLPDPRPFGHFITQTTNYLESFPLALVGEVGLDRSFRIPESWLPEQVEQRDDALTPGGREGRRLSPYRVSMDHQRKVLLAQLRLAGKLQRAVSVHGVQAHGMLYDTISETWKGHEKRVLSKKDRKKQEAATRIQAECSERETSSEASIGPMPYPPRICLHSFSGPPETVKQYIAPTVPCEVFFSFSTTINSWSEDGKGKVEATVRQVPDDRIVIESDLHTAGDKMDFYLQDVAKQVCKTKDWELEHGLQILRKNWQRFVCGE